LLDQDEIVARLRAAGCVFAEEEADLIIATADSSAELEAMLERRVGGDPLEHVLGWVEFCGQVLAVDPGVFVPRRRTELLVTQAVARCPPDAVVVDLCCGNGAVGASIAAAHPDVVLHAADIDPAAVACARRNLEGIGTVHLGDFDAPLPAELAGRVDVLVANVPYVPSDEIAWMPPEARDHEPRVALDGGADGLDVARRVIAGAPQWLAPGGSLLFETSAAQAPAAVTLVRAGGLVPRVAADDEVGATVVIGTLG
jgi:release factor glutamine methyltransferase